jgi:hypothetical protein
MPDRGRKAGDIAASSRSPNQKDAKRNIQSPFRVLGIALVVDQMGKRAKMVLRYPTSPLAGETEDLFFRLPPREMAKLFRLKPALCGQPMTLSVGGTVFCCYAVLMDNWIGTAATSDASNNNSAPGAASSSSNAAAATAPSDDGAAMAAISPNATATDQILLFSLIVALAPPVRLSTMPIAGWFDGNSHEYHSIHPTMSITRAAAVAGDDNEWTPPQKQPSSSNSRARTASPSFLSLRRVHLSLARVCRLLEREERRCQYVSIQTDRFQTIGKELEQKWQRAITSSSTATTTTTSQQPPPPHPSSLLVARSGSDLVPISKQQQQQQPTMVGSPSTTNSKSATAQGVAVAGRHRRNHSFSFVDRDAAVAPSSNSTATIPTQRNVTGAGGDESRFESNKDFRQEFLDSIMSSTFSAPADENDDNYDNDDNNDHGKNGNDLDEKDICCYGNLARELVQVYHALARNDHDFAPSPPALLSGRDGIVYINGHLAVPIEAASLQTTADLSPSSVGTIRPYQTLIFPHVSAAELLGSLSTTSTTTSRRLQQFLREHHVQKSLADIAVDANLPLHVALDLAGRLVDDQAVVCWIAPSPLSWNGRLACRRMDRIPAVSLAFSQTFGHALPVFHLVAYLTSNSSSGRTGRQMRLKDALLAWKPYLDDCVWLRAKLRIVLRELQGEMVVSREIERNEIGDNEEDNDEDYDALEDLLYKMTTWLFSHKVLEQMEEYFVGVTTTAVVGQPHQQHTVAISEQEHDADNDGDRDTTDGTEHKADTPNKSTTNNDLEALYNLLADNGCLDGNMSVQACSWVTGIDTARLRMAAIQHPQMRLVLRLPAAEEED